MTPETKKSLVRFLWQLLSALLAAFGGAAGAHAATATGLI